MKRWSNEEVAALSASVAENGYSKGIREFINSSDNVNGRTFAGCEYVISKQSKQCSTTDHGDAVVPISEPKQPITSDIIVEDKKESVLRRVIKWIFGV